MTTLSIDAKSAKFFTSLWSSLVLGGILSPTALGQERDADERALKEIPAIALPSDQVSEGPFASEVLEVEKGGQDANRAGNPGSWTAFDKLEGQLVVKTRWTVPAPMSGVIEKVDIQEGDAISVGQPIAEWNTLLVEAELAAALAAFRAAELESDQSFDANYARMTAKIRQSELERSLKANQVYDKAVSAVEMERLELAYKQAILSEELSKHKQNTLQQSAQEKLAHVELLRKRIARGQLTSRLEGTVVEVLCRPGQWVNEGATVAQVVDLRTLRFETFVDSKRMHRSFAGQRIEFTEKETEESSQFGAGDGTISGLARSFQGVLVFVSPEINPVTQQVRVIAEIENHDGLLRPGMIGWISKPSIARQPGASNEQP